VLNAPLLARFLSAVSSLAVFRAPQTPLLGGRGKVTSLSGYGAHDTRLHVVLHTVFGVNGQASATCWVETASTLLPNGWEIVSSRDVNTSRHDFSALGQLRAGLSAARSMMTTRASLRRPYLRHTWRLALE